MDKCKARPGEQVFRGHHLSALLSASPPAALHPLLLHSGAKPLLQHPGAHSHLPHPALFIKYWTRIPRVVRVLIAGGVKKPLKKVWHLGTGLA